MNVAASELDIARPKANEGKAGYTPQEREKFAQLLDSGFVDSYRYLHPDEKGYTWWSYRAGARAKNIGWRLDYFLVSDFAADRIKVSKIMPEVFGSDHCPIMLEIDL